MSFLQFPFFVVLLSGYGIEILNQENLKLCESFRLALYNIYKQIFITWICMYRNTQYILITHWRSSSATGCNYIRHVGINPQVVSRKSRFSGSYKSLATASDCNSGPFPTYRISTNNDHHLNSSFLPHSIRFDREMESRLYRFDAIDDSASRL